MVSVVSAVRPDPTRSGRSVDRRTGRSFGSMGVLLAFSGLRLHSSTRPPITARYVLTSLSRDGHVLTGHSASHRQRDSAR